MPRKCGTWRYRDDREVPADDPATFEHLTETRASSNRSTVCDRGKDFPANVDDQIAAAGYPYEEAKQHGR